MNISRRVAPFTRDQPENPIDCIKSLSNQPTCISLCIRSIFLSEHRAFSSVVIDRFKLKINPMLINARFTERWTTICYKYFRGTAHLLPGSRAHKLCNKTPYNDTRKSSAFLKARMWTRLERRLVKKIFYIEEFIPLIPINLMILLAYLDFHSFSCSVFARLLLVLLASLIIYFSDCLALSFGITAWWCFFDWFINCLGAYAWLLVFMSCPI